LLQSTREIRSSVFLVFWVLALCSDKFTHSSRTIPIYLSPTAKGQTTGDSEDRARLRQPLSPIPGAKSVFFSFFCRAEADHGGQNSAPSRHFDPQRKPPHGWRPDDREEENGDPVLDELKEMGEKGDGDPSSTPKQVIEILEGQKPMRGFGSRKAKPDAVRKIPITPLQDRLKAAREYTLKIQGADKEWRYQQPLRRQLPSRGASAGFHYHD